jgi:predicted aspartyl protease
MVIIGKVSDDGVPLITVEIATEHWPAIIDTGFNGDLELPEELYGKLNEIPVGRVRSALAGGETIDEDAYMVAFPFDDETVQAIATFAPTTQILIETNLLINHRLQIGFASKTLQIEREAT